MKLKSYARRGNDLAGAMSSFYWYFVGFFSSETLNSSYYVNEPLVRLISQQEE